jgi:hypothetical protein
MDGFEDEAIFPILNIAVEFAIGKGSPFPWILEVPVDPIVSIARKNFGAKGLVHSGE